MNYYIDLFSPETYQAFTNSDRTTSGFRKRLQSFVEKLNDGDKLICYVTRVSRWVGVLEVTSKWFEDNKLIFIEGKDPFVLRVKVKTLIWLPLDKSIPMHEDFIWNELSFTKGLEKNSLKWTGIVRNSLNRIQENDGVLLIERLNRQFNDGKSFPLSQDEKINLSRAYIKL